MDEDTPFGSRGGTRAATSSRSTASTWSRSRCRPAASIEVIWPRARRSSTADRRRDGSGRFTIAARPARGPDPRRRGAPPDAHLKVRVPVKAGHAHDSCHVPQGHRARRGRHRRRLRAIDEQAYFEGVGSVSVAGPLQRAGPGATPSREQNLHLPSGTSAAKSRPAPRRSSPPRAPRVSPPGR